MCIKGLVFLKFLFLNLQEQMIEMNRKQGDSMPMQYMKKWIGRIRIFLEVRNQKGSDSLTKSEKDSFW